MILVTPIGKADVGDFDRRDHGVGWCVTEIVARLIDNAAVGVGHFTRGRVLTFLLDDAVEDGGVSQTHHDVVWFEVGMDNVTFGVEVIKAQEKAREELAEIVAAEEVSS